MYTCGLVFAGGLEHAFVSTQKLAHIFLHIYKLHFHMWIIFRKHSIHK